VVLVSCDLFAVPLKLNAKVWNQIKGDPNLAGLKEEGLVIAATHDHQGPGNYMSSGAYNSFGSAEIGYSDSLFTFLKDEVATAISRAASTASPSTVRLYQGKFSDSNQLLVNRSPGVFMLNWDANYVLGKLDRPTPDDGPGPPCPQRRIDGEPTDGWDLAGCPRLRAVERRFLILEARNSQGNKVSDLVFFASHPTVLFHSAPLYNSDFVGIAMDAMERETPGLTAGFFNGAEGDIEARRVYRDVVETRTRGMQLLSEIKSALSGSYTPLDPSIIARAQLVDVGDGDQRECKNPEGVVTQIANYPLPGTAQVGGGELDRTAFYDLGWKEGVKSLIIRDGQGPKQAALDSPLLPGTYLTLILSGLSFPRHLPVGYIRIGTFGLGAIPVEMSTTGGFRIREYMESHGDGVFQIIGLASEYASYAATASEYAAQDYMGASTLWGPKETEFLACQLASLRNRPPSTEFKLPQSGYDPGVPPVLTLGPSNVGQARDLPDEEMENIIQTADHLPARSNPFFEWSEPVPDEQEFSAASNRKVSVIDTKGNVVDDTDLGFLKILKQAPQKGCETWDAIWIAPLWTGAKGDGFRFQVEYGGMQKIRSMSFSVPRPIKPTPIQIDGPLPCQPH